MRDSPQRTVLNVGGLNKNIAIPAHFNGWKHVLLDIDPTHEPDICMDARLLHTLPPAQYNAIYCHHNLEHYSRRDGAQVLQGFGHVLKPDGFVEVHVPNLGAVFHHIANKRLDVDDVLYHSTLGPILVRDVLYGYHAEIDPSGQEFWAHRTGFTDHALIRFLNENGFPHVGVGTSEPFNLFAYAFKQLPTPEQQATLKLRPAKNVSKAAVVGYKT